MTTRFVSLLGALGLCLMAPWVGVRAQQAPPPQIQSQVQSAKQEMPAFRSRITLVPLDVRVLDRDGKPVTDCRARLHDPRERRAAGHRHVLRVGARARGAAAAGPPVRAAPGGPRATGAPARPHVPAHRRPGPHPGAVRRHRRLITFVRERLLPQDRVAVMAYHRITDFTTDHEQIVACSSASPSGTSGSRPCSSSGGRARPPYAKCPKCLPEVDPAGDRRIFLFPGAVVSREMAQGLGIEEDIYRRERRYFDALLHGELAVGRESNLSAFVDEVASRRAELSGASSSATIRRNASRCRRTRTSC